MLVAHFQIILINFPCCCATRFASHAGLLLRGSGPKPNKVGQIANTMLTHFLSDVVRPSFGANRFKIAEGCARRTTHFLVIKPARLHFAGTVCAFTGRVDGCRAMRVSNFFEIQALRLKCKMQMERARVSRLSTYNGTCCTHVMVPFFLRAQKKKGHNMDAGRVRARHPVRMSSRARVLLV